MLVSGNLTTWPMSAVGLIGRGEHIDLDVPSVHTLSHNGRFGACFTVQTDSCIIVVDVYDLVRREKLFSTTVQMTAESDVNTFDCAVSCHGPLLFILFKDVVHWYCRVGSKQGEWKKNGMSHFNHILCSAGGRRVVLNSQEDAIGLSVSD